MKYLYLLCFCPVLLGIWSCSPEAPESDEFEVVVRLAEEPDMIHPIISRSAYATQIENHLFLPCMEFDPKSMEYSPVLVSAPPEIQELPDGEIRFNYIIHENAKWSDGKDITAKDYLFTVKAVENEYVEAATWRGPISFISEVIIYPDFPKKFSVTVKEKYLLAAASTSNFNIYPAHSFDPMGLMENISLEQIRAPDSLRAENVSDRMRQFASSFNLAPPSWDSIAVSGAYQIEIWETGREISLRKITEWWAEGMSDKYSMLTANPDRIIYKIIPDENTAVASLKAGEIDVLAEIGATAFTQLKEGDTLGRYQYLTPSLSRYFYLGLNGSSDLLENKYTRRALAHLLDVDAILQTVMGGFGMAIVGPVHPQEPFYHEGLKRIQFSIDSAKHYLTMAGWEDSDNNGIVDKSIRGQKKELNIDIMVTRRPLGQKIALIWKESAAKAGVSINLLINDFNIHLEEIRKRNYHSYASVHSSAPGPFDPYQSWHTDNDRYDGSNYYSFGNSESDSLIHEIRTTLDLDKITPMYHRLQEMIYDEQPCIFILAPVERIIVSSKFKVQPSVRRPGYFENYFESLQ